MSEALPFYLIYLLHAEIPNAQPGHYIGITTPLNWRRRMQDHQSGNGGARTRRWFYAMALVECVNVIPTDDPLDERHFEAVEDIRQFCWRCRAKRQQENSPRQQQKRKHKSKLPVDHHIYSFTQEKGRQAN